MAAPEPVLDDPAGEVADDLPVVRRDGAARRLRRQGALDLAARVAEFR
jgi:hypothetical protein